MTQKFKIHISQSHFSVMGSMSPDSVDGPGSNPGGDNFCFFFAFNFLDLRLESRSHLVGSLEIGGTIGVESVGASGSCLIGLGVGDESKSRFILISCTLQGEFSCVVFIAQSDL